MASPSTTVEVNAGALQVNTEQAGVSDVITKAQIDSLPVNGRNFLDLAQIEPGVILQSGESFDPTKAGYSAISTSGVSGRTTRILLDGQDITDETVGTTIFNVSQGAIGDFQLNRSTQDVSGDVTSTGQVLVSTNSGTNAFHGQAFYQFQDHSALFARTAGGIDTPFQRNQFGGSIGGPIIKDKLFFFGNAERIKQESPVSVIMAPTFAAIQQRTPPFPLLTGRRIRRFGSTITVLSAVTTLYVPTTMSISPAPTSARVIRSTTTATILPALPAARTLPPDTLPTRSVAATRSSTTCWWTVQRETPAFITDFRA